MKVHELNATPNKNRKRVGRGDKTAGRGTKGQNARTGKKLRAGFMGGQGTLMQRVPKLGGFKSLRVPAQVVYTGQLALLKGKIADNHTLAEMGLIASPYHAIKIIFKGELQASVTVKVQAVSKGAIEAIEKAGGSFEKVAVPLLPSSKSKKVT